jgi:hypothetical protein
MKKGWLVIFLIACFILSFLLASAADDSDAASSGGIKEKAIACLEKKVDNRCASLTDEEKAFTVLAIKECKSELASSKDSKNCWPKSSCKLKTTAQAILALKSMGDSTSSPESWLLAQKIPASNIQWLLQIDTNSPTSCTVDYGGKSYTFEIDEEKKISKDAGSCLRRYEGNYWFLVADSCQDEAFEVSCSDSFDTSLIYKAKDSSTFYVSSEASPSTSDGTTSEKVKSFCFKEGTTACDYEGTLWAVLVLSSLGHDISEFLPYLVTNAEENSKYLPEAFLSQALGETYQNDLLLKQAENKWWDVSGDKFYDTAVALYPLEGQTLEQKTNALDWLESVQSKDGCWQNNLRDTAFLVYSIFIKHVSAQEADCEGQGYYCLSAEDCSSVEGGELEYEGCFGEKVCCSKNIVLGTCSEQEGKLCDADETCIGGETAPASDGTCCINGECGTIEETECEKKSGYCQSECGENEKEEDYECDSGICCVQKTEPDYNYTWMIVLGILIALTLVSFLFKNKLRQLFFALKHKFRKSGSGSSASTPYNRPPSLPPPSNQLPIRGMPRRIIPSQYPPRPQMQRMPAPSKQTRNEFDDVLKKLKEISK